MDEDCWHCNRCDKDLPITQFAPSSIQHNVHRCRNCNSRRGKAYFKGHREVFVRSEVCKRDGASLTNDDVRRIFDKYEHRCYVSGRQKEALTLVLCDPGSPKDADNYVPCCRKILNECGGGLPKLYREKWVQDGHASSAVCGVADPKDDQRASDD